MFLFLFLLFRVFLQLREGIVIKFLVQHLKDFIKVKFCVYHKKELYIEDYKILIKK